MDAALGVGSPEGPIQSPSYTMGIAKVNQYYRERNYEVALMELNNILSFYPNSPKLLKMKGTLLIKTGNHELAMRSWQRALDLAPSDVNLGRAVKRLQERMVASQPQKQAPASSKDIDDSLLSPEVNPLAH
jgi:tetratricopeptide (TPR) repeat protein